MSNDSFSDYAQSEAKIPSTNHHSFSDEREFNIEAGDLLGERFEIGQLIKSVNHADVYSVKEKVIDTQSTSSNAATSYEARLFRFDNIPPEHRRYRVRAMKRLQARKVLETTWRGGSLIIYKTGMPTEQKTSTHSKKHENCGNGPSGIAMTSPIEIGSVQSRKNLGEVKPKTNYQRESARLRQRDRRQRQRQHKCTSQLETSSMPSPGASTSDSPKKGQEIHRDLVDEDFTLFSILHVAHAGKPELRQKLSPALQDAISKYLRGIDKKLEFESSQEIEEFLAIKEREAIFLQRQAKSLPTIKQHYHQKLGDLLREQAQYDRKSQEWKTIQNTQIEEAKFKMLALTTTTGVLPNLIKAVELSKDALKQKLKAARQSEAEAAKRDARLIKRDTLSRKVTNLRAWIHQVVLGSATYAELFQQLETATRDLRDLEE